MVKLSDAVQQLPRQTTEFVHGVPNQFLDVGEKKAQQPDSEESRFGRGAYFMGKAVWAKVRRVLQGLCPGDAQAEGMMWLLHGLTWAVWWPSGLWACVSHAEGRTELSSKA